MDWMTSAANMIIKKRRAETVAVRHPLADSLYKKKGGGMVDFWKGVNEGEPPGGARSEAQKIGAFVGAAFCIIIIIILAVWH